MIRKLWFLLNEKEKRKAIIIVILMLLGALIEMLGIGLIFPLFALLMNPTPTFKYYDYIPLFMTQQGSINLVIYSLLFFLGIYILKTIYLLILLWKQSFFANKFYDNISNRLFSYYISQKYKFHLGQNSSILLRNVVGETGGCTEILKAILSIFTEITVIIGICFILIILNPINAIFVLTFYGILIYLFAYFTKGRLKNWGEKKQELSGLINKYILESFGGIKEIKFYERENYFFSKLLTLNKLNTYVQSRINFLQQVPRLYLELITIMCLVGIIFIELYFGGSLLILIPQLTVFLAATFRIIPSANKILTQAQVIKVSNASIDLVYQELSTPNVSNFNNFTFEGHQNTFLFKSLELRNISFRYNLNEDLILNNLNFKIIKGESIGIKGESGAGKSTFIDIILGLLTPHEGSIILNGENDQSKINGKVNVGYVPQNIFLLDESIEKNIALGIQEDEIDSSKILLAIKSAQLETFVHSLPNGLKTVIGERGIRLSGGQRQRIGIARALYNDPEIIILDEATSSLDNETEASFMKTIYSLKGDKTLLIVAHRLSTLNNCDKILTINKDF